MISSFWPSSYRNRLLFCLLLVSALGSRVYKLDAYGLFVDEKFTLLTSIGVCVGGANQRDIFFDKTYFTPQEFWREKSYADFEESTARSDIGAHLPYNYVLYAWRSVFGSSDASLRFLSVLFGLAMMVMLYALLYQLFQSETIGLIAMGLALFEPLFLALNHLARSYSMSLFLCVWSSYLFLKLMEDRETAWRYLVYVLVTSTAVLTHFLNGMVLLIHGIYVLIYLRPWVRWWRISVAAGLITLSLVAWLTVGGGQYTFQFLADKNELMLQIVQSNPEESPMGEALSRSTLKNVYRQYSGVLFDSFVTSNHLVYVLHGLKNAAIVVFLSILTWASLFFGNRWKYQSVGILIVHGLGYAFLTHSHLHYAVFEVNLILLFWGVSGWSGYTAQEKKGFLWLSFFVVLPLSYLLFDAFKSGHTGNITQRYGAYALPFVAGWLSFLLFQIRRLPRVFQVIFFLVLLSQAYFVFQIHAAIYRDQSGKYSYFEQPRIPNPHRAVALKIQEVYQPGDTIVYPSFSGHVYADYVEETERITIDDAQYINAYLPQDAQYWQRIDPKEPHRVILRKPDGTERILFDFQGRKYRY